MPFNGIMNRMTTEKRRISLTEQFEAEKTALQAKDALLDKNEADRIEDDAVITNNEGLHQSYSNPYHRAPDFPLYLWAVLPILLVAFSGPVAIILAVLGTIANFFLIHIYTRPINRYLLTGIVNSVALVLYLLIGLSAFEVGVTA
ncbi:MAG: Unknown protein [uncultured Thiotrichaceae bacterium]|uniref:Uncharacterized protein n=1 Tax=uncultured Thiotrichaceae bacterium TaxID=298394 RepID=A0A6S6T5B2_9GAMM|nr:MAG: Unknown protein [uncultured Thiotrichaceae bacterium]